MGRVRYDRYPNASVSAITLAATAILWLSS